MMTGSSMTACRPTVPGPGHKGSMFGSQQGSTMVGVPTHADAGSTQSMVGHGFPMSPSAGRLITTAAGASRTASAGFGSPETVGGPPGCPGVNPMTISPGHRCRRFTTVVVSASTSRLAASQAIIGRLFHQSTSFLIICRGTTFAIAHVGAARTIELDRSATPQLSTTRS